MSCMRKPVAVLQKKYIFANVKGVRQELLENDKMM